MEFGKKYSIKVTMSFLQVLPEKDTDKGDVVVTMNREPLGVVHTADDDAGKQFVKLISREIGHVFGPETIDLVRRKLFDSEPESE